MTTYTIIATHDDNGQRCLCDRSYALGDYADQTWTDRSEADAVADYLRSDVGDVVDETVEYEVVEAE